MPSTSPLRHASSRGSPTASSDVEAAALPLAGLTAWQALVETADVQPGQRVLILAAAGGVGHLAVQIAKARGAYVIGTASSAKHAFLREIGADETIDYTSEDVAARVRDVDVVLDLVGGDDAGRTLAAVRDGGIFIRVPSASDLEQLLELAAGRVRVTGILVEPDRLGLEALAGLVEPGELRVHVARTFPLARPPQAHELGETGHTQGKLVLTVG